MMKRALAILLTAMMLLSMVPAAAFAEEYDSEQLTEMSAQPLEESSNPAEGPAFSGGGSEEEPYEIDSEDSLKLLATLVNEGSKEYAEACYILVSDICLTGAWTPIGSEEHPFSGSFDGNGKKIAGLSADSGEGCFGLFGAAKDADIYGVALDDVNVEAVGYDVIGAIVGYMQGGSLSESYAEGTVNGNSGKYCGGLAGCAEGAEIANCFSAVEMEADGYVGGIAGFGCDGTAIDHCYNIGFIYSNVKGAFGSVLGNTGENIDLSDCYCIDTTDKGAVFLSREEAADKNSFAGFDFDGVWFVDNSSGYPYPVLKVSPSKCDAKWAPDTTEYPTGYVDNEEHSTPLSKNAMQESNSKDSEMYASRYVIPNLPAVRDQGSYGTCWAHAILAAAETNIIKKGYADSSVNLSELQFVWFHHTGTLNAEGKYEDPLNNFGGDRNYSYSTSYGFWGGDNYYAASKSAASWIGLINEDEITAYSQANAESIAANGLDYSYAFSKDAVHLENVKMIPTNAGTAAVKKALLEYGAVCFSYLAGSTTGYYTSNGKYYFSYKGETTNHAVSIVGWDDNVNKNLFYDTNNDAVPKNDGAWIVRNSYGSSWGDGGYFYMSYESTYVTDGNRSFFAFDFEPAESYEKCYQYDGSACYVKGSGFSSSNPRVANIFTASGNDIISAVSFWMEDNADLNYTVKVYTNLTDGSNPTSGTLAASVSGQTDYAGYYTVALPKQVSVNSGAKFSVVLEIKNDSGKNVWFPYDGYRYYSDNDYYDAHSSAGQSFYCGGGTTWYDKSVDNGGNYRIKAFTTDNPSDPRPAAPTVSVSGASGKMVLSWSAVSNAASYTVYRAITPDGSYSEVGTTTSAGYTDKTAVSGTVYYYRVTAKSTGGNLSRYSNTASGLVGTQNTFIISYDANGGSGAPAYQIKTAGTALTLSEAVPTHEGYTFLGWSEDSSAKTPDYASGANFTKNADTTLYAVWLDGILVNSIDELESEHNYANNLDQKWYFTDSEALSITLTFDSKTKTEASYDFIYIYDGNKNLIGKYSGSELASKTVTIPGNTVCIQLTSDVSYNYYGFKVSSYQIEKNTPYTVKFVNHDGTVLQTGSWYYGETPEYTGETPTKASTEQYNYFFKGWSPAISAVTGDVTYTAQFREIVRQYTVTFKNDDGKVLMNAKFDYGSTPSYTGATPTKAETAQYSYTFTGWSPAIAAVTGDATYTAQYSSTVRQYTVKFVNGNTVLQTDVLNYGATPSYTGATPTKAETAQYSYTFKGWSPAVTAVTGDVTYTAQFNETVKQYTVTFKNHDGTVLKTSKLDYGATPAYSGTPAKNSTAQYTYTFTGWSPAISAVTGDVTYTAQFKETLRQYTVTFKNDDGTVLKTSKLDYGATPSYTGTPTKASTAQHSYTFTGWSPALTAVTGDATYTAQFKETARQYTVTFKNDDGTVLKTSKLNYGATPSYTGTPTKASTAQYDYTFTGWSPAISTVTGDATYTAQYSSAVRQYTVKFVNGSTVLQTNVLNYGATPSYTGATPTKAETAQYTYTFKGWSPAVSTVTGDVTYTAQFKETVRQYTLTVNYVSADTGFKAPAAYTASVNYGASYTKASPSVTGYVCDTTTVTGTMGTGATVKVTYYKVGFTWNGTSAVVNAGTVLVNQAAAIGSQQTKAPTCTANGTTKYTASYTAQNQTFTAEKSIDNVPAINHANKVKYDAVPATCLAAGNIAYYYCPDCKCYFKADMTATTAEGVVLAKLDHEYEFTANTAAHTITATCKNGCNDTQVLTLSGPTNPVYDGSAKTVTADKTTLGGENVSAVSYFVMNAQGVWDSAAEAVNAGSYKATVSVGGASTEYTFTIAKATPVITVSCADIDADATPAPVCELKGSDAAPVITYSADGVSYGTWDEVRGSADTYYVKAYLAATDNSEEAVAVASFNVSSGCAHTSIISIREGRYLLYLNDVQVGYVTFTQKDGKWAINVEGKGYLSCDGSNVSYSSTPYYWTHNGTGFTVVKSETTGRIIKKTKNVTYYLSYGGEGKGYSLTKDATISVIMDIVTGEQHTFAYRDNGDGTHTKYCTVCGKEYATTACTYDESTHCCSYCGHGDPTVKSVKANVTVNKTYNSSAWTRFWRGDYTYSVSIAATANNDTVKSVQYSTNGSKWTTGTSFSQYKDVGTLYVRVTTGSGDTYNFVYQNGTTTPVS